MMLRKSVYTLFFLFVFSSFFLTDTFALNKTFSGTGNFSSTSLWDLNTLPTASDNVTINGSCTLTSSFATTGSLTVSGTLQLGVYSMTSGDLQGAGTITSSSGTPALTTGSNHTSTTFSGVIGTGVIAFTKNGTGALTLSGNNTYTGTTTIAAGTIKLNHTNALGTIAGATSVTSGAVLDLNGINYSNAEILTLNGTGISTGGALINSNATAASYAGNITLGSSSQVTANNPMTLSGVISGSPDLTTAGTSTLLLSGANTNTGINTLLAGSTLKLGNAAALGGVLAADYTVINIGAVLDLNGINYSSAELLTLNGTGISSGGALTNNSGTPATFAGPITLASASSIEGQTGTITITGTITGATFGLTLGGAAGGSVTSIIGGAGTTVTKNDAGTWTLSGLNTYTGSTIVSSGILRATNNTIVASTNGAFGNNASGLFLDGGTIQSNVVTFSRPITVTATNSGIDAYGSACTISSTITLSTAGTYNLNAGGTTVVSAAGQNLTLSGVISYSTGTLSLTKIGTSNLLFGSQAVTLDDLTISAGALTSTSTVLSLAGDFSNNGTYTHNSGNVNFNGAGINTVTGSSTTAFNTLTINKGTDYTSNILDVQSLITMTAGGLTLINGTFKLSSNSTITPFTISIATDPYLVPATAGIWCNGGTLLAVSMQWNLAGLLRVTSGTVTVGTTGSNIFVPQVNSVIILEGGNLNSSGRISNPGFEWSFTMTGGNFTINTVGTSSADRPPFHMDVVGCSFSMSGGIIVIQRPGGTAGQNLGFHSLATGGTGFTGGTLQIGNGSTPAASTIGIISTNPIYNLTVNSANVTTQLKSALTVTNAVTISAGVLSANNLNLTVGGDWINNVSTVAFTGGTASVIFNGTAPQSIAGSFATTFNNLTFSGSSIVTPAVNASVTGNLLLSSGTLDLGSYTANRATSGGTLTLSAGTILKIGGTNGLPSNYATHSINATSTVEYNGVNQSVSALISQSYGNLIISNSGTKTLLGAVGIVGDLTVSGGTFNLSGYGASRSSVGGTLTLSGTATLKTGAGGAFPLNYTTHSFAATSTVEYVAPIFSGVVALNSSQNYGNLTISGSGSASLASNLSIDGDLTISGGLLHMNGRTLNRSSAGGTLTLSGTGALTVVIAFPANFTTHSIAATSTIEYGNGSHVVAVLNSSQNYGNLRFSGGGSKSLAANTAVAGDLTIVSPGWLSTGIYTLDRISPGGTLTVANGGILYIGGTNTFPVNYSTHVIGATSNISYNGSTQSVVALNSAQNYGNLTIANTGTKTLTANIGVAGNLSVSAGVFDMGSFTADRTSAGGTLSVNATLKIGGTNTVPSNYTAHAFVAGGTTVEYYGSNQTIAILNSSQNYHNLILSGSGTKTLAGSIAVSGNWTNNGVTFIPGSNTVTFNGTGAQAINGTAPSQTFNNIVVSKSVGTLLSVNGSTATLTTNDFTLTSGNFTAPFTMNIIGTATSSLTLTAGTFSTGIVTTITGDWINNGGTFTPGANTVIFNGNGAQAITGTAASQTFYNVTIVKPAGTILSTSGSTNTLTVQDFTETSGDFTAPATLNINGNQTLTADVFTAGTTTNVKGNWTIDGTFNPGSNTVVFKGSGVQTINGTAAISFYNLTLNTVGSTDVVQLSKNATVTAVLSLTNGVLDLNSKSLSITSGLAGAITRTSGYILSEKTDNSSKIIWSIGSNLTTHTFPFGTAAGTYIPFIMNLTAGDIGNATVSTYPTAANNTPYPSTPVSVTNMYNSTGGDNSANTVDRFWQINKDGASGTATITFTSTSAEMGTILFPTAQRYDSSTNKWQAPLSGQTNTATSATVPGVTTFSPWTLSGNAATLPIEILTFTASVNEAQVDLNWSTASELNNDFFTVEKTIDLVKYIPVGIIDGAGNSTHSLNYTTPDINPYRGVSYYRLKQTDYNGTETYSNVVSVYNDFSSDHFIVYPNPLIGTSMNVIFPDESVKEIQVILYSMSGQEVFSEKVNANGDGSFTFIPNRSGKLSSGIYLLTLISDIRSYHEKLIVQ